MSWANVLEALSLGLGGGLGAYATSQAAERERLERERQRREDVAYRNRTLELQRENAELQRDIAMAGQGFRKSTPEAVEEFTVSPENVGLMRLRENFVPTAMDVPAPEGYEEYRRSVGRPIPEVGEGGRMADGTMVAPGDTYAARNIPRDSEIEMESVAGPRTRVPGAAERGQEFAQIGEDYYIKPFEYELSSEEELAKEIERADALAAAEYKRRYAEGEAAGLTGNNLIRHAIGQPLLAPERPAAAPSLPTSVETYNFLTENFPEMPLSERLARSNMDVPSSMVPKEPELPSSLVKSVAANESVIQSAQEALKLIESGVAGGTGWLYGLPLGVGRQFQRLGSEEDRVFRAMVGNIGSKMLNELAGTAISAAEFARLTPFVPEVGESVQDIRTKLTRLSDELRRINENYYRISGVTPPPQYISPEYESPEDDQFSTSRPLTDDDILNDIYGAPGGTTSRPLSPFRDTGNIIFRD